MSLRFEERLHTIVEKVIPEHRLRTQQEVASVFQAGGHSFDSLFRLIQDPAASIDIRCTACWIAGRLGNLRAVKALLVALGAQEPELRAQAAISLGELQSKEGIPFLLTCMLNDPDIEVRTSATYGLGLFFEDRTEPAQEQVTQTLISVLSNERESPKVRGQAAEALANRGDHQALFPLQTALDDASVEVRFWAVFALGQLGDPYALTALERVAATDQAVLPGWWSISKEARDAIQQIQERQSDENRER